MFELNLYPIMKEKNTISLTKKDENIIVYEIKSFNPITGEENPVISEELAISDIMNVNDDIDNKMKILFEAKESLKMLKEDIKNLSVKMV